jgi:Pirin
MIKIRKSEDRGHADHGWLNTYHSFSFGDYYDPKFMGFRTLHALGAGFGRHGHRDMEILTGDRPPATGWRAIAARPRKVRDDGAMFHGSLRGRARLSRLRLAPGCCSFNPARPISLEASRVLSECHE